MKIITILLLMISTQAQAQTLVLPDSQAANFTVKQCNQIANISKRTIKAAISGVPIAEVIEKFGGIDTGGESLLLPAVQSIVENTVDSKMDSYNPGKGASIGSRGTVEIDRAIGDGANWSGDDCGGNSQTSSVRCNPNVESLKDVRTTTDLTHTLQDNSYFIRAIYKTVDQIKTKYGQVREQDRVRLNNRVEQKLVACQNGALSLGIESMSTPMF